MMNPPYVARPFKGRDDVGGRLLASLKGSRYMGLLLLFAFARPLCAQETHLIVIVGSAGDQEHSDKFHKWATTLIDAARRQDGVADGNITYLAERPEIDPSRIGGRSTRENVEKTFADLSARVAPNDQIFVVLFGHGSFDGRKATFNLPGPDLTAEDYAKLLDKLAAGHVVFVDTTSASGAFLQPLAGANRVIVTATKTGGERNETEFPQYFVEAFATGAADRNRDGRVSVMEAFEYARTKVTQAYQQKGLLMTEHAAIEDGSGGNVASTLFMQSPHARSAAIATTANPALRSLLEEKLALEDQIAALKLQKPKMDPADYEQALEKLATDLALKTRAIQQIEGKKP